MNEGLLILVCQFTVYDILFLVFENYLRQRGSSSIKKKKLIEGRCPNVFIASTIATATGQTVEYTRHKAFDKKYYKDLIIAFIDQHGKATSNDILREIGVVPQNIN